MSEQASEKKTCEKKSCAVVKVGAKVLIGVVLIVLGLWAVIGWWPYLLGLIRGCLGLLLIMAGAITVAIAKE